MFANDIVMCSENNWKTVWRDGGIDWLEEECKSVEKSQNTCV